MSWNSSGKHWSARILAFFGPLTVGVSSYKGLMTMNSFCSCSGRHRGHRGCFPGALTPRETRTGDGEQVAVTWVIPRRAPEKKHSQQGAFQPSNPVIWVQIPREPQKAPSHTQDWMGVQVQGTGPLCPGAVSWRTIWISGPVLTPERGIWQVFLLISPYHSFLLLRWPIWKAALFRPFQHCSCVQVLPTSALEE